VVNDNLRGRLQTAFTTLLDEDNRLSTKAPGTVHTVLDPSMYAMQYGRSRAFQEEVVGVRDAVYSWAGKGSVQPITATRYIHNIRPDGRVPAECWSIVYQWYVA
jgi:hypothetical protein